MKREYESMEVKIIAVKMQDIITESGTNILDNNEPEVIGQDCELDW